MLNNPNLPTRDRVKKAWAGFTAFYPKYLDTENRGEWLIQDKIVYDYMVGTLMTKEEWEARDA